MTTINNEQRWLIMIDKDLWWSMMIYDDRWWSLWSMTIDYDRQWLLLIKNDWWWSMTINNDWWWLTIIDWWLTVIKRNDSGQLTGVMLHVTYYMWYMTCDKWKEMNNLWKFQVSTSSYGLGVKVDWRFGGKRLVSYWMNELINKWNRSPVYRTAPAKPGLLISLT